MPWVQIPVGPSLRVSNGSPFRSGSTTDAPSRESVDGKGSNTLPLPPGRVMTTVCTCNPGVHWTRSAGTSTDECESTQRGYCANWWMARLERRRRTCQAAISLREPHGGKELRISEWESPPQLLRAMGNAEN